MRWDRRLEERNCRLSNTKGQSEPRILSEVPTQTGRGSPPLFPCQPRKTAGGGGGDTTVAYSMGGQEKQRGGGSGWDLNTPSAV